MKNLECHGYALLYLKENVNDVPDNYRFADKCEGYWYWSYGKASTTLDPRRIRVWDSMEEAEARKEKYGLAEYKVVPVTLRLTSILCTSAKHV